MGFSVKMTTFLMYIKLYFPFKKNPVNKEKYSFKVYFTMLDGVDVALTTNLFFQMIQHKTPRSKSFDAKLSSILCLANPTRRKNIWRKNFTSFHLLWRDSRIHWLIPFLEHSSMNLFVSRKRYYIWTNI